MYIFENGLKITESLEIVSDTVKVCANSLESNFIEDMAQSTANVLLYQVVHQLQDIILLIKEGKECK